MKTLIFRLLTAIAIVLMLQGCAEVVVAGGAAAVIATLDPDLAKSLLNGKFVKSEDPPQPTTPATKVKTPPVVQPKATPVSVKSQDTIIQPVAVATVVEPAKLTDQPSDPDVMQLLEHNRFVDDTAHVHALLYHHTLLLTGEVRSEWLKQYISDHIDYNIKSINKIYNYLTVNEPSSKESRTDDAKLTIQVVSQLSANHLDQTELRIFTAGKTVYLMGLADKSTQEKIVLIVKQLPDVRDIVPLFDVAS